MTNEVTVTLNRIEYHELCNLVQMVAVVGIPLRASGRQPNTETLKSVFHKLATAGLPNNPIIGDHA